MSTRSTLSVNRGLRYCLLTLFTLTIVLAGQAFGQSVTMPALAEVGEYPDTIRAFGDSAQPGASVQVIIVANNSVPVNTIKLPVEFPNDCGLVFDSFSTVGCRTEYFEVTQFIHYDPWAGRRFTLKLVASEAGTAPDLQPGYGPILFVYFTIPASASEGQSAQIILDGYLTYLPEYGYRLEPGDPLEYYSPGTLPGQILVSGTCCAIKGDVDHNGVLNALDLVYLRAYLNQEGPEPPCMEEADVNGDGEVDNADLSCMSRYFYSKNNPCVFFECH